MDDGGNDAITNSDNDDDDDDDHEQGIVNSQGDAKRRRETASKTDDTDTNASVVLSYTSDSEREEGDEEYIDIDDSGCHDDASSASGSHAEMTNEDGNQRGKTQSLKTIFFPSSSSSSSFSIVSSNFRLHSL